MCRKSSRVEAYLRKFVVVTVELICVSSEIQLGTTSISGSDYFSYVIRQADRNFFLSLFIYLFVVLCVGPLLPFEDFTSILKSPG